MASIQKKYDENGKPKSYRVMWRANGKQKSKSFDRFKNANDFKTKIEHQLREGSYVSPAKTTVKGFMEEWLPVHTKKLADRTKNNYRYMSEKFIYPNIGSTLIQKLSAGQIESFYNKLTISPKSIKYIHVVLKAACKAATRQKVINSNPCDLAKLPKIKSKFEGTIIPPESLDVYLSPVKGSWAHIAVLISLSCGLRLGEVIGLKWSDINFKNKKLSVERTAYRLDSELLEKPPKNGKPRTIIVPDVLIAELKKHKRRQKENRLFFGLEYIVSDYVVTHDNGRRPRPDGLSRFFRRRIKAANLPHIRFHDLRHTAATLMILSGADLKTVSVALGHSSIAITVDIYGHIIMDQQKYLAESMNKYLEQHVTL